MPKYEVRILFFSAGARVWVKRLKSEQGAQDVGRVAFEEYRRKHPEGAVLGGVVHERTGFRSWTIAALLPKDGDRWDRFSHISEGDQLAWLEEIMPFTSPRLAKSREARRFPGR